MLWAYPHNNPRKPPLQICPLNGEFEPMDGSGRRKLMAGTIRSYFEGLGGATRLWRGASREPEDMPILDQYLHRVALPAAA